MSYRFRKDLVTSSQVWLGDIPQDWGLDRLGKYFKARKEKVSDTEYPPLSVTMKGIVPQLETAAKTDAGDNRKRVCIGDFVINSRSDRKGSSGVSALDGSVSLISIVLEPRDIHGGFIHQLLRSYPFQEEFYRFGKGIVADLWSTNYSEMKNIIIPVPSIDEQTTIANFLDRETAKIDTLIDKQEQLIKLLEEKRQAVISRAVTKGLNPDVRMKDSGVEWLGEVPEHWDVKQVRHLVNTAGGGTPSKEREDYWAGDIPWISPKDMKRDYLDSSEDAITCEAVANSSVKLLPSGCLLIVVRGMILAHSVPVGIATREFTINQDMKALMPHSSTTSDYLLYLFKGLRDRLLELVEDSAHGTKKLGTEMFQRLPIPIPPMLEQGSILKDILRQVGRIDLLVDRADKAHSLLVERRTALISAAVTGKIDVREAV